MNNRKQSQPVPSARIGIEITKIVREVQSFTVSQSTSHMACSIGKRVDEMIEEAVRRGDELQSVTIHLDDPAMRQVLHGLEGPNGGLDTAGDTWVARETGDGFTEL